MARLLTTGALGLAVIAVVVIGLNTIAAGDSHTLYATFDNAIQMTPGQQVRMAGRPVGEISNIKLVDGQAQVTLKITADSVWPVPRGTYARARWGSTTAYLGRYTELIPGPKYSGALPDGGILNTSQNETAFELDQAYRLFRGRTKTDAAALLNRLGETLQNRSGQLSAGLAAAPAGLNQAADLMEQFSSNDYDLHTLAEAGNRTVTALAQRSNDLGQLVTNAAGTFATFAQHTGDEQQALDRAPQAFNTATSTFARLDTSLNGLNVLINDLRPGAPALTRLAGTARLALATLREVAPQATATLRDGIAAAPSLRKLFTTGTAFMPPATAALRTFDPMFSCIRPYAPDIAGFLTTWPGMTKNYDAGGHYARAFELTVIPALYPGTPLNSKAALALSPGLSYAFPRPPGLNDGHPYFLPECGITQAALNPADDPEGAGK